MALPTRRPQSSGGSIAERSDPLDEFEHLQSRMERLMESVWSGSDIGNGGIWVPLADIEETEDAWIVEAELPGVKRSDINVELRDSELTVTGEIKERERKGILRRRTRRTGRFEYRVMLPADADPENVEAKLDDGILTIRILKAERSRARNVEVTSR